MKKFIEKFIKWIWDSSGDPASISLTVKGVVLRVVAEIIKTLTDAGIAANEATITAGAVKFLAIFSTVLILIGLFRKFIYFIDPGMAEESPVESIEKITSLKPKKVVKKAVAKKKVK